MWDSCSAIEYYTYIDMDINAYTESWAQTPFALLWFNSIRNRKTAGLCNDGWNVCMTIVWAQVFLFDRMHKTFSTPLQYEQLLARLPRNQQSNAVPYFHMLTLSNREQKQKWLKTNIHQLWMFHFSIITEKVKIDLKKRLLESEFWKCIA